MLYSDVTTDHAPTRIRVSSHRDVPPLLVQCGEAGTSFVNAVPADAAAQERPVVEATGDAGDAYLCNPFLVHSASWPHRGSRPRFMGQPAILHAPGMDGFEYDRPADDLSPCERSVREVLTLP